jgi:Flp pilus assembly pilin Flp
MPECLRARVCTEEGQTMPEYAVVLAILTIATAALFTALSGGVANAMTSAVNII